MFWEQSTVSPQRAPAASVSNLAIFPALGLLCIEGKASQVVCRNALHSICFCYTSPCETRQPGYARNTTECWAGEQKLKAGIGRCVCVRACVCACARSTVMWRTVPGFKNMFINLLWGCKLISTKRHTNTTKHTHSTTWATSNFQRMKPCLSCLHCLPLCPPGFHRLSLRGSF